MPERKTVVQVISKVDALLSKAEDEISSLTTIETKAHSPQAYKLGNEAYDRLEQLRWWLRDQYKHLGKRR